MRISKCFGVGASWTLLDQPRSQEDAGSVSEQSLGELGVVRIDKWTARRVTEGSRPVSAQFRKLAARRVCKQLSKTVCEREPGCIPEPVTRK